MASGTRLSGGQTARRGPHRLVNAHTHDIETFNSSPPPYAILSHTWGAEEFTLQDWQAGSKVDTDGHYKVLGTCERALHDGIDYVWVDTCCIDKTNDVELTEAINSMFRWYQDANICYVLLSDVAVELQEGDDDEGLQETGYFLVNFGAMRSAFHFSRYFTRGWTLQEMLAAKDVLFFAVDGTFLGDLRSLGEEVSSITKIDVQLLGGDKTLDDFTIPQKISWASHRDTSRIEDRAYSLLGILQVSMDLRYGDGEAEFARLQKEILKQPSGIQVLVWNSTNAARRNQLLAASPDDFDGCSDITSDASVTSGAQTWETNVGLKGSLPIFHRGSSDAQDPGQDLIALDCYKEEWPEDIIALRVKRQHGNLVGTAFHVDAVGSEGSSSDTMSRLDRLDFDEYATVRRRDISLLWDCSDENRQTKALNAQDAATTMGYTSAPRPGRSNDAHGQPPGLDQAGPNMTLMQQSAHLSSARADHTRLWQSQITRPTQVSSDPQHLNQFQVATAPAPVQPSGGHMHQGISDRHHHSLREPIGRSAHAAGAEPEAIYQNSPSQTSTMPTKVIDRAPSSSQRREVEQSQLPKQLPADGENGLFATSDISELPAKWRQAHEQGNLKPLNVPRYRLDLHIPSRAGLRWKKFKTAAVVHEVKKEGSNSPSPYCICVLRGHELKDALVPFKESYDLATYIPRESRTSNQGLGRAPTKIFETLWSRKGLRIVQETALAEIVVRPQQRDDRWREWMDLRYDVHSAQLRCKFAPPGQIWLQYSGIQAEEEAKERMARREKKAANRIIEGRPHFFRHSDSAETRRPYIMRPKDTNIWGRYLGKDPVGPSRQVDPEAEVQAMMRNALKSIWKSRD